MRGTKSIFGFFVMVWTWWLMRYGCECWDAPSNSVGMVAKEVKQDTSTTILMVLFSFFGMKHHWVLIYEEK